MTQQQMHDDSVASRHSRMIWEVTQAIIALSVTAAMIYAAVKSIDSDVLKNAFFLIVGFYFTRNIVKATNGSNGKDI